MSWQELTPIEEALQKCGLGFIGADVALETKKDGLPQDLHIDGNSLKWTEPGSSAKVPGRLTFSTPIGLDQKKRLVIVGVPEKVEV